MALFKEKSCAHCGKRANMLTRIKLVDDRYICGKCVDKIPMELSEALNGRSYNDFLVLNHYVNEINPQLEKRFHETHRFHGIHLDAANELFYLDGYYPTIYCRLGELNEFEMQFAPDEVKDGFFGAKVIGKIYLRLRINKLMLFVDKVIARDVKAEAKVSGFGSKNVTYQNPRGMDEFLHHFNGALRHALEQ